MQMWWVVISLMLETGMMQGLVKDVPSFGIYSREDGNFIQLRDLNFQLQALDGVLSIEIIQHYYNNFDHAIDAFYVLPTSSHAAVTNISLAYANSPKSSLKARLLSNEASQRAYNESNRRYYKSTHLPYNETQMQLLSASLGQIEMHEAVEARVVFVETLRVEDLAWKVHIPMNFTPRYWRSAKERGSFLIRHLRPYTTTFRLRIESSSPITRLVCPSHQVKVEVSPDRRSALVRLEEPPEAPDRDFVLLYRTQEIESPHAVLQKSPAFDSYALLISFLPFAQVSVEGSRELDQDPSKIYIDPNKYMGRRLEFIFILDCSGSMRGRRIEQAKEAALLFVRSLPSNSYFNFVFFGSTYKVLFPSRSMAYTSSNVAKAIQILESVAANMGTTDLYAVLNHTLNMPTIEGYARSMLLLTDGDAINVSDIIKMVEKHRKKMQVAVHTIGIGKDVDNKLVREVAKAGFGAAYFVSELEPMAATVIKALSSMCVEQLHNLTVEWPTRNQPIVAAYPIHVFYNEPVIVLAIFPYKPRGSVLLHGFVGTQYSVEVQIPKDPQSAGKEVYQLAVKHGLQSQLDTQLNEEKVRQNDWGVKLATNYSVLVSGTSFILTTVQKDEAKKEMIVPVATVKDQELASRVGFFSEAKLREIYARRVNVSPQLNQSNRYQERNLTRVSVPPRPNPSEVHHNRPESQALLELVATQDSAGYFAYNSTLIETYMAVPFARVKAALSSEAQASLRGDVDNKVLNTVAILHIIQTRFQEQLPNLALIVNKAKMWLRSQGVSYALMQEQYREAITSPRRKYDL